MRQVAYALSPPESLGEERGAGARLSGLTAAADPPRPGGSGSAGESGRQRPSGRDGGAKKTGPPALGKSRGGWTTQLPLVAAAARTAVRFSLSAGQVGAASEGRKLLGEPPLWADYVVMDRAYEGAATQQWVPALGTTPVVPPKSNRTAPWPYDREKYKHRNEVERLFRRLTGCRRIFSRFDKLEVVFACFIHFALIFEALKSGNTP